MQYEGEGPLGHFENGCVVKNSMSKAWVKCWGSISWKTLSGVPSSEMIPSRWEHLTALEKGCYAADPFELFLPSSLWAFLGQIPLSFSWPDPFELSLAIRSRGGGYIGGPYVTVWCKRFGIGFWALSALLWLWPHYISWPFWFLEPLVFFSALPSASSGFFLELFGIQESLGLAHFWSTCAL